MAQDGLVIQRKIARLSAASTWPPSLTMAVAIVYSRREEDRGSASLKHGQVSAEPGSQVSAARARGRAIGDEK